MRILRVCWEWPPPWSGLAPGPYEITAEQAGRGHVIEYLCGGAPGAAAEEFPGVRVTRTGRYQRLFGPLFTGCVKSLKLYLHARRHADVLHGHGILTLWINLLRIFSRRDIPYVYHFHSCARGADEKNRKLGISVGASPSQWIYRRALSSCERMAVRAADHIIAVSESVKDEIVRYYGAPDDMITVVDNGVNCSLFSPDGPDLRERFGFSPEDKILLFVGILRELKNVHLIIEALSALPENTMLLAAGPWEKEYKLFLDRLVAEKGLQPRVVFTGPMDYRELPSVYRTGDVFMLPSATEGFPKVVLEAAAAGLPVIASGFRTGNILGEAINFLDESKLDAGLIAETAKAVLDGKGNRPADVDRFSAVYDWSVKVDAIEKIYMDIAGSVTTGD